MQSNRASAKDRRSFYGKAPLEFDLTQAVEAIDKVSREGKVVSPAQLALLLGNTVTSSAFTRKVRALSSYGLLELQQDGNQSLTDLALAIALPRSQAAQMMAKQEAFLKLEPFRLLFNQHKGKLLPADEFMRNILEQDGDIPREMSDEWARHFRAGAKEAGLLHARSDGKIQLSETPLTSDTDEPVAPPDNSSPEKPTVEGAAQKISFSPEPVEISQHRQSGHYTRIDLSDGRCAEFRIPDRLNTKDAQRLQKALEGIGVIIESMIIPD